MKRWDRIARGAGLVVRGVMGPGPADERVSAGLSGIGLLADALKLGQPSDKGRLLTVDGIGDRLAIIAENVRTGSRFPRIIKESKRLLSRRCGDEWCVLPRDEVHMIEVLHAFVRDDVRWTKDPVGIDLYAHPRHTIEDRAGDCAHKVGLLGAMLGSVGIACYLVAAQELGAEDFNHVWLRSLPEGLPEVPCDPTFDSTIFWRWDDSAEAAPAGWELPRESLVKLYTFPVWG